MKTYVPLWSIAMIGTPQVDEPVFRYVRKTARSDYLLRHVCPFAGNNMTPSRWILIKFDIWFMKICRENSSFIKIGQE